MMIYVIIILGDSMANRATRRKEKKNIEKNVVVDTQEEVMSNAAKVSVVVTGIFVVFYVIAVLLKGGFAPGIDNDDKDDNDKETVTIQYDEILAGETFKMPYQEYYVIFFNYDDKSTSVYEAILSNFKKVNTNAKVFKVDLNKGFNIPYISETSNHNAATSDELKINGPTLIKIKDGRNVTYVEGKDSIKEILK